MTSIGIMDALTEWMEDICADVQLKVPNDDLNDDAYEFSWGSPSVFQYFVPPDEITTITDHRVPSVCIQIEKTVDDYTGKSGVGKVMDVRLVIQTWNPGIHVDLVPTEDTSQVGGAVYTLTDEEYERNLDGWKDVVNLQDMIVRSLQANEIIEGMQVDVENIEYGPYKDENDNIYVLYPYYAGYITFKLKTGVVRVVPESYKDIL